MLTVNLTTTFQRLSLCRIALSSILLQSKLPDQVNLWVSREPYLRDKGIENREVIDQLLDSLPDLGRDRIHVHWVSNTGPYRKLIPMLRQADLEDVLVTADDDIFYGRNWLSGLLETFERSSGKAVACRVRSIRSNFLGKATSYLHWKLINHFTVVKSNYVVTFGAGAVLTRAMFRDVDVLDDSFLEVAPTADDLWYSKLLCLNAREVVVVPSLLQELHFLKHGDGLVNHNRLKSKTGFLKRRFWDRFIGFLGVPVCGNDVASVRIDQYFRRG